MKKKINQINRHVSIVVSCYKYAPESISAMLRVENPDNPDVPAYYKFDEKEERAIISTIKEQGYNWVCGKHKEVFDAIKKAVRKHQRKGSYVVHYGFKMLNNPDEFAYLDGHYVHATASLQEKADELRKVRKVMEQNKWQMETHTLTQLGAGYKVEKTEQHFQPINPNAPIARYAVLV